MLARLVYFSETNYSTRRSNIQLKVMREIKFRIRKKTGEWAYFTIPHGIVWVDTWDRKTLGEFTGLKDKNGKEIYEGDIFPCLYAFDGCTEHTMRVEYNEPRAGFFPRWNYSKCQQKGVEKTMHDLTTLKIIGNIYENPELLKL